MQAILSVYLLLTTGNAQGGLLLLYADYYHPHSNYVYFIKCEVVTVKIFYAAENLILISSIFQYIYMISKS